MTRAPVRAAIRAARSDPSALTARSPRNSTAGSPDRSATAAAATRSSATRARAGRSGTAATAPPSPQAVSAGRISVATPPGAVRAAAIASAPSWATRPESGDVLTQLETALAMPSTSEVSGASKRP